ncbi:MAG: succinate dehydrogenase [Hyphomicrobiales bacterium]
MTGVRLYALQRLSAGIMSPLVLLHLATILYAVANGLSAGEILTRTQGSTFWALFYGIFVLAASVHASIGLRTIAIEWTSLDGRKAGICAGIFGLVLLVLGLRAVTAVVVP